MEDMIFDMRSEKQNQNYQWVDDYVSRKESLCVSYDFLHLITIILVLPINLISDHFVNEFC